MSATPRTRLDIDVAHSAQLVVITARGEIDLATVCALTAGIDHALSHRPAAIVVDLTEVTFLTVAGIDALASARGRAPSCVTLILVTDDTRTVRPIELLELDAELPVHPDLSTAMASLTNPHTGNNIARLPAAFRATFASPATGPLGAERTRA